MKYFLNFQPLHKDWIVTEHDNLFEMIYFMSGAAATVKWDRIVELYPEITSSDIAIISGYIWYSLTHGWRTKLVCFSSELDLTSHILSYDDDWNMEYITKNLSDKFEYRIWTYDNLATGGQQCDSADFAYILHKIGGQDAMVMWCDEVLPVFIRDDVKISGIGVWDGFEAGAGVVCAYNRTRSFNVIYHSDSKCWVDIKGL
jgi:hypothetical protein